MVDETCSCKNVAFKNQDSCKLYRNSKIIDTSIGDHVIIGEDSYVSESQIADNVQINRRNFIIDSNIGDFTYTGLNTTIKHADIGKFSSVSWNVSVVGGGSHDMNHVTTHPFYQMKSFGIATCDIKYDWERVKIGNDVWIGAHVCVLPGITIGNGAVIGANSVVTKDVPPYAVVAGNPAKLLKYRFDENIIEILNKEQWWNWPVETLKKNIELFSQPLTMEICDIIIELNNKNEKHVENYRYD